MSNRKKAAELLIKSRRSFNQSESIEKSLELAISALVYLKTEEITPYIVEWVAFLYGVNQKRVPESLRQMIPNDIRFLHLKMQFLIQDQKFFEAHKLFIGYRCHSRTCEKLLYKPNIKAPLIFFR